MIAQVNYESWTDEDVSLQTYFNEIASSQPLSREKEAELAERIAAGDERAREELAEANLLFVVTVAKQYRNRGLSFSELISAGNLGLMTAVDRFDATRGYKFISYAVWWIRQAIQQALAEDSRTVRLPLNRLNLLRKIAPHRAAARKRQRRRAPRRGDRRGPGAVHHGGEGHHVERAARRVTRPRRLRRGRGHHPAQAVGRPGPGAAGRVHHPVPPASSSWRRFLRVSDEREHEIIQLYFGLDGSEPMTLEQIGDRMGLTRERIRQLKERAFCKLRHPSRHEELRPLED